METNDKLIITITDVNVDFKGTYVHPLLFDHILMWIDKSYAIKVSVFLNQKHINANKEKDDKIDELNENVKNLLKDNKDLKSEMNKLMIYAKDTNQKVTEGNELIKELINLIKKVLRMNYRKLYSINDVTHNTKVLTGFVFVKKNYNKKKDYLY